jgi:hypothetical protein
MTLDAVVEARSLPVGTPAQNVELIAFMPVLQLAAGMWVNTYTDS